jgi:hypothetical protein
LAHIRQEIVMKINKKDSESLLKNGCFVNSFKKRKKVLDKRRSLWYTGFNKSEYLAKPS